MKILAFDPGRQNFAYAFINSKGKCRAHGFIDTVQDMTYSSFINAVGRFTTEIQSLLDKHTPQAIMVERMQHRPHLGGGGVVEYINLMIGIAIGLAHSRNIKVYMVPSNTWKKHYAKAMGIHDTKKQPFKTIGGKATIKLKPQKKGDPKSKTIAVPGLFDGQPGASDLTEHEADAIGIGCYCWHKMGGVDIAMSVLT